jgi:hypothetical protein
MEVIVSKNRTELERLEGIIARNLQSFYEVGRALMEIRDKGLYRDVLGYQTFEEYCRVKWDMQRAHAYRLIDSAKVLDVLSPTGDTQPTNERQTSVAVGRGVSAHTLSNPASYREMHGKCIVAWNAFRRSDSTALKFFADKELPKVI